MRLSLLVFIASTVFAPVVVADFRHDEDASLRAVQFVDRNEGWAVGDDGVIWHTIDGGQTWERQPSGTRASLRSIHFVNPYVGWIAGREELPYGGGSVGCLLYTSDGGLKWRACGRNAMPGLNQVRFVNERVGFVAGDGSDQFPTGLFSTNDGGRNWQPVAGLRYTSWLAADFSNEKSGVLVGAWSRLGAYHEGTIGKPDIDTVPGRNLNGIVLDGRRAVAVGHGGAVLLSKDSAGLFWSFADNIGLPLEVLAQWDLHAVHSRGDAFWIVGRPGSAVLHSPDWGKTWQVQKTGQSLPLHGVFFVDGQRGWAVGDYGCILGTVDGGKSWKALHRGGLRAGVLFVHARPTGVPLDTLAQIGGEEGYLAAALLVHAADSASAAPARAADEQRWAAAVGRAGGAAGEMLWQFPLPQYRLRAEKNELVKAWNRQLDDRAMEQYLRQMVLALRTWKPAVVVTDHPDGKITGYSCDALVAEAAHEAFRRAGDPKAFPEQLDALGLEPWQPNKLYARWEDRGTASVTLDGNEIGNRLEASYRDFAEPAAALLTENSTSAAASLPPWRAYRLLETRVTDGDKHRFLMDGVGLEPGGTSRRELSVPGKPAAEIAKAIQSRRNLEALTCEPVGDKTDSGKLLAQLGPLLSSLPDDQACAAAYQVGSRYSRAGQWLLAREVFLYLVNRYPAHPRALDAYRWLARHGSSSEARRRFELGQFVLTANFAYHSTSPTSEIKQASLKGETQQGAELLKSGAVTILSQDSGRQWYQGCLAVGERIAAFGPLYATDPALQFCMNSSRRNLGEFDKSKEWCSQFRNRQPDGPWKAAAAAELWLSNRTGPAPKPYILCRQTTERPHLDGQFDDACWLNLKPLVLRNAVGDTAKECTTEVRLAYDQEYLYLALRCTHPEDGFVERVKVRNRDADLRAFDRVSLMLDLDRDYSSYFHLHVDQRGCVRDECGLGADNDVTWNPRWFVAVHSEKTAWQVEAAIPLMELTGDKVSIGKAWACNVVRVLPNRGLQALSLPADVEPRPEGMGLLMFVNEHARK